MSHLAHIVKLKSALIMQGIVNPNSQADIAQTAYVKALINVNGANKLNEDTCINFNQWILSYWNETTPVKGNLVASQVGQFFRNISNLFNQTLTSNVAILTVVPKVETTVDFDYTELSEYKELVQSLIDEANKKLPQFTATETIV
jgi:hypothetical protein